MLRQSSTGENALMMRESGAPWRRERSTSRSSTLRKLLRLLTPVKGSRAEALSRFLGAYAALAGLVRLVSTVLFLWYGARQVMILGGLITVAGISATPLAEFLPVEAHGVWPIAVHMVVSPT